MVRNRARARIALGAMFLGAMVLALASGGCEIKPIPRDPMAATATTAPGVDPAKPVAFGFTDLDGKDISGASMRGRTTVVLFATSYDPFALAEARFLIDVEHTHKPRLNVFMLDLERIENRPLVEVFANALDHPFPICMADGDTIAGRGPFVGMNSVPAIVVLDKDGHEKYRHAGFQKADELEAAIKSVE